MTSYSRAQRTTAEFLGTALLLAAVVGSGIMAERLAGGNEAVALLANTVATGAALVALIAAFAPISGAHLNPAVTAFATLRGEAAAADFAPYVAAQIAGALAGVALAHVMFGEPVFLAGAKARSGIGLWTGEAVATAGLLLTIWGVSRSRPESTPFAVAAFITAAYWFTSSTSFANPAVTIARALTPTFSGIVPAHAPGFVVAQAAGVALALAAAAWLTPRPARREAGRRTEMPTPDPAGPEK